MQNKRHPILNALVAERVMGWRWFQCVGTAVLVPAQMAEDMEQHPTLYTPLKGPGKLKREHVDGSWFYSSREGYRWPQIPNYAEELKEAMAALKVAANGAYFEVGDGPTGPWGAVYALEPDFDPETDTTIFAKTLALSAVYTALAAHGVHGKVITDVTAQDTFNFEKKEEE